MSDPETLAVYDERAGDYAAMEKGETPGKALASFMELARAGGNILDLGCGPGRSGWLLKNAGFCVDAVDASAAMVDLARDRYGLDARLGRFEDDYGSQAYDGIWANFSLLHAPRDDFANLVGRLALSLKPAGIFHIGMKTGKGEGRDRIGRYYAYYSREELISVLEDAGLHPLCEFSGEGAGLSGEVAPWVEIQARKT